MARTSLPCNMAEEEAAAYLAEFYPYLDVDEQDEINEAFEQYLFYETWGRRDFQECTCTHKDCGTFELYKEDKAFFKRGHGDVTRCPNCGGQVTLISLGRMRSFKTLEQEQRVTICRVSKTGALLLTAGWAKMTYSWDDLRPAADFKEKRRYCFLPGKRMQWDPVWERSTWDCITKWSRVHGWVAAKTVQEPFLPYMYQSDGSYFTIAAQRIGESALKYCQVARWYTHDEQSDGSMWGPGRYVVKYLSAYTQYPAMEMAVRLNLYGAVTDLVVCGTKNARDLDWAAKSIYGFVRMPKADAKLFFEKKYNLEALRAYHAARKTGTIHRMEEFASVISNVGGAEHVQLLTGCAKIAGCTIKQAVHYLKDQAGRENTYETRTLSMWRDYLDMGKKLEYDLSRRDVVMPKDLFQRHDDAAATIQVQKDEIAKKAYRARYKNLQKLYGFALDGLLIKIPSSAGEIVQEGKALQHCVGGYAERHVHGACDILFLRDAGEPDKPLVTIEMTARKSPTDKVKMVQIHGFRNERGPNAVDPMTAYGEFVNAWLDWLRSGSPRDRKGNPIIQNKKEKSA